MAFRPGLHRRWGSPWGLTTDLVRRRGKRGERTPAHLRIPHWGTAWHGSAVAWSHEGGLRPLQHTVSRRQRNVEVTVHHVGALCRHHEGVGEYHEQRQGSSWDNVANEARREVPSVPAINHGPKVASCTENPVQFTSRGYIEEYHAGVCSFNSLKYGG